MVGSSPDVKAKIGCKILERKDSSFEGGQVWDLYKATLNLLEDGPNKIVPLKLILNSCVPPIVYFFGWDAWWCKILAMDQLKKRWFHLANWCPLCGKVEEEMNHFLVHCPSVWSLWEGLISLPCAAWVSPL